ncbi:MAG: putative rane protein [Thermoleophilaceae bacterium]|jgi:cytochrome c oxidase assembly factor CtaG|nr:putative rane protein [Thermoleophilaceae bacterium]
MSFQAGPALVLALLGLLYVRAVRVLGRRGYSVPPAQQAYWWAGFVLLAAAFFSPLDSWAQKLVSAHMAQHVLMADIAAPLLLIGVRNPVLQFYLPRPILEPLARRRGLRAVFRKMRSPMVAIPLYTVVLYAWHLGPAFEAALRNNFVHALQHQSFIAFSVLAWWPLVEPQHRRMPGHLWKIPYIVGARLPTMFLGMAFIVMQTPFYASYYGTGKRLWGFSPLSDQQFGGAIMMMVDVVILMVVLCVVFFRAASDNDAKAPPGEARAERHLGGVQDEREVQPGVQVAEVGQ